AATATLPTTAASTALRVSLGIVATVPCPGVGCGTGRSAGPPTPSEEIPMSMRSFAAGALLTCFSLTAAAQQPNPLDNVPDKMPFDVPYGAPISLDRAQAAINAAVAESRKRGWKINVAVVESDGNMSSLEHW